MRTLLLAILLVTAPPLAGASQPVPHHDIWVNLDPETRRIEVENSFTFDGRDELAFRLAPWLTLESAQLDGEPIELESEDGHYLVPLDDEKTHRMGIVLNGEVPAEGPDFAGPEGSFLSGYSGWFLDTGDPRMTYRLVLQVPAGQRIVASGQLIEEEEENGTYQATMVGNRPSERPSLFAGPYEIKELRDGDVRLRSYFHPEVAELADDYLAAAAQLIERYSEEIGPYPYEDFHIISAPIPVGLGFPNLTYVGRRVLPLPFMRGRSLAHEVLHNWWGNGVAIGPGGNWSEGLTTYMADYALSDEPSAMRLGWLRDYGALPADRDGPVTAFRYKVNDASQVVGYGKVAFIFYMLEQEIGEAAFSQGLRAFWRDHQFKEAGWAELQAAFEQAAGRELDWFFSQWVERKGAPRLEIAEAEVLNEGLSLVLRQEAPAYRLSVPLELTTSAGTRVLYVDLEGEETRLMLPLDGPLLSLRVDPAFDVFRRLLPGESAPILRDVTLASDTATVVLSDDDELREIAAALAARLLDTPPRFGEATAGGPLLVIGLSDQVAAAAQALGAVKTEVLDPGSVRAWATRTADGRPAVFVAADDAAAFGLLLRRLPHYGASSYAVFEARRPTISGFWRTGDSPLSRQFAQ
ncbi:MAG: M1 family aminopeptidase [Pseudomonadota bacterium]